MSTYTITATYTSNGQPSASCSTPEVLGESYGVTYATREEAEEAAEELQSSIADYGLDGSTRYHIDVDGSAPCGSGEATGVRCSGAGTRTIEWMPVHLRASHVAAGNGGIWPHNGAERLLCCDACADSLLADDAEWASEVVS